MSPVKEMALIEQPEVPQPNALAVMVEQLAKNPDVSVDKLRAMIEMQKEILAYQARVAFQSAYSRMQPEIPVIDERGRIEVKGQLRNMYAPLEDIHEVVKPIMARYGFAIRHRTEWPADRPGIIRIVGILTHEQGHEETSTFEAPMDRSEYRTDIQSQGSTVSYGRRYTTTDLLNISTRKSDNDGRTGKTTEPPKAMPLPTGFENWLNDMYAVAREGTEKFRKAWKDSKEQFRTACTKAQINGFRALADEADERLKAAKS